MITLLICRRKGECFIPFPKTEEGFKETKPQLSINQLRACDQLLKRLTILEEIHCKSFYGD